MNTITVGDALVSRYEGISLKSGHSKLIIRLNLPSCLLVAFNNWNTFIGQLIWLKLLYPKLNTFTEILY